MTTTDTINSPSVADMPKNGIWHFSPEQVAALATAASTAASTAPSAPQTKSISSILNPAPAPGSLGGLQVTYDTNPEGKSIASFGIPVTDFGSGAFGSVAKTLAAPGTMPLTSFGLSEDAVGKTCVSHVIGMASNLLALCGAARSLASYDFSNVSRNASSAWSKLSSAASGFGSYLSENPYTAGLIGAGTLAAGGLFEAYRRGCFSKAKSALKEGVKKGEAALSEARATPQTNVGKAMAEGGKNLQAGANVQDGTE